MEKICNTCACWSREVHHPSSKWFWACNHRSDSKENVYTAYNNTCKCWKSREEHNEIP